VSWETFHTTGDLAEAGSGAEAVFLDDVPVATEGCGCAVTGEAAPAASCCAT
jgi:hypothetical protein